MDGQRLLQFFFSFDYTQVHISRPNPDFAAMGYLGFGSWLCQGILLSKDYVFCGSSRLKYMGKKPLDTSHIAKIDQIVEYMLVQNFCSESMLQKC
jgi:hypothetical protein